MIHDCGPQTGDQWPMPDYPHRPGVTPRPPTSPAFDVARRAPETFEPSAWNGSEAYLYGFALYRAGYYWEAHEVWEAVWQACRPNSRERHLVQALIQIANAGLKQEIDRPAATRRLLHLASHHLAEALPPSVANEAPTCIGVDVAALQDCIAEALREPSGHPTG